MRREWRGFEVEAVGNAAVQLRCLEYRLGVLAHLTTAAASATSAKKHQLVLAPLDPENTWDAKQSNILVPPFATSPHTIHHAQRVIGSRLMGFAVNPLVLTPALHACIAFNRSDQ